MKKSFIPNSLYATSLLLAIAGTACKKDKTKNFVASTQSNTITVENVLQSKPLVQTGTFKNSGTSPVIKPGESTNFEFYAGNGQALSFACMYGASNDLFFAPENPGIALYDASGNPIEGDVSAQIKIWDNGTKVNQTPNASLVRPGTAESKTIAEVAGTDAQGNAYLPASSLMKASLKYLGNSKFSLTISNTSTGTANETPFSPGVWAISYKLGADFQDASPIFKAGSATANGLTKIAEMGNTDDMKAYLSNQTGAFTPFSPVLVVVYNGISNPLFKVGEKDKGKGLSKIAQMGDASVIATYLKTLAGVKDVYVLEAPTTKVLLPYIGTQTGGKVSQQLKDLKAGDKIALATMYGFSNDWFLSNSADIDATTKGDVSSSIKIWDNGTVVDQFPGAGIRKDYNGVSLMESKPIAEVAQQYISLPAVKDFIKVSLQ